MSKDCYFGTYAKFDTESKEKGVELMNADYLVGDPYTPDFRVKDDVSQVWLINRFGGELGFLDPSISRRISIFHAREWKINIYLSYIAYTCNDDDDHYWGEVAVVCFDPKYEQAFTPFCDTLSERLKNGVRPDIKLNDQELSNVLNGDGTWFPKKTVALPGKKNGTVIVKSDLSASEKVVEQARKNSVGCYVVTIIILVVLILLVLLIINSCSA